MSEVWGKRNIRSNVKKCECGKDFLSLRRINIVERCRKPNPAQVRGNHFMGVKLGKRKFFEWGACNPNPSANLGGQ